MNTQEKTQRVAQILIDTINFRSVIKKPFIIRGRDQVTGKLKDVRYTGDIEESQSLRIEAKKFTDENIYLDEVYGILEILGKKCGFTYNAQFSVPKRQIDNVLIVKNDKIKWSNIIKELDKQNKNRQNKQGEAKTFPHKLPAGTIWENFIAKFIDDENLLIEIQGKKQTANFSEMGFEDKRTGKPNLLWFFLKLLAEEGGEITPKSTEYNERYKKIKQGLSNKLKYYFKIEYDPFYPYRGSPEKSGNSYKIKMTLIPPPTSEIRSEKTSHEQIEEFFKEQTPQIYEEDNYDDS